MNAWNLSNSCWTTGTEKLAMMGIVNCQMYRNSEDNFVRLHDDCIFCPDSIIQFLMAIFSSFNVVLCLQSRRSNLFLFGFLTAFLSLLYCLSIGWYVCLYLDQCLKKTGANNMGWHFLDSDIVFYTLVDFSCPSFCALLSPFFHSNVRL